MRLLGCFSKQPIVIQSPSVQSESSSPPSSPPPEKKYPNPTFVPASIPELHPEYAHSEPYCFAAKTDSARLLVDRARRARGQPPLDPAVQLRQQGHVVVRGPTYSLNSPHLPKPPLSPKPLQPENQVHQNQSPSTKSVPLQVETPDTDPQPAIDSDDQGDENVDVANVPHQPKSAEKKTRSLKKEKKEKTPIRRPSKPKQKDRPVRKSKATSERSQQAIATRPPTKSPLSDHSDKPRSDISLHRQNPRPPRPDTAPRRTYSSSDYESEDTALQNAMARAPAALLAPIVVPRMSQVYPEPQVQMSPSVSVDSWAPSDSGARFDDVEDESSSGLVALPAVGKGRVIHKAETLRAAPTRHDDIPLPESDEDAFLRSTSVATSREKGGLRSKRKSKPFLHSISDFDAPAPELAPDSAYSADVGDRDYARMQDRDDDRNTHGLGAIPKATSARQISGGGLSDEIMQIDTSGDDLCDIPPRVPNMASKQRGAHDDLGNLPRADALKPQSIMRRASTGTKRKTVSFHDAAPVIIEPNLRAPSRSLPRDLMYSKDGKEDRETSDEGEFKDALDGPSDCSFSGLTEAQSSNAPPPVTMELPRLATRELSDSTASEDNFAARSSRRMSRVSVHDKAAIREASKRQSQAVAKAMSQQIRGVPRSAMLAYSEHEIVLEDDALEADEERSGHLSFRRRSRTTKSIRVPPKVIPGQVPPPPPPPPFEPETLRVRSVRKPPPPPSAYKKQN